MLKENCMLEFKISPSTVIESYFAHRCQRNLLYMGVKGNTDTLKALGLNRSDGGGDDTAAIAGQMWERKIAEKLLGKGELLCKDPLDLLRKYNVSETVDVLKEALKEVSEYGSPRYVYQAKLRATEDFYKNNIHIDESMWQGNDPDLKVAFSEPETDFLKIWKAGTEDTEYGYEPGQIYLSVIDAKLAKRMKLEHKVQVAMYVRLLSAFLKEHKIGLTMDDRFGYLWNFGQEKPAAYRLSEINDILDDYLNGILPETLKGLRDSIRSGSERSYADSLEVCVGGMCEYCENYRQCRAHLEEVHSVQLLPYLSGYAQRYLRRMELPDRIEEFIVRLDDDEVKESLRGNHSWENVLRDGKQLELQCEVMAHDKEADYDAGRRWRSARSFHMPVWQDIALILTAQKDVGTDRVYVLGYRADYIYEEKRGQHTEAVYIAKDPGESAYVNNALDFIKGLYSLLSEISGSGHSLQVYVMDSYERMNLEEMLYDILQRDTLLEEQQQWTIGLILWIQGERVITDADEQPVEAISYPIVELSSELRKLVALPLYISYSLPALRSTLRIKVPDEYSMAKGKSDYNDYEFFGALSNAVPSKMINEYWSGKRKEVYGNYQDHLKKRFELEKQILSRLQSGFLISEKEDDPTIGKHLLAKLKPFVLPGSIQLGHPLLRKWMFQTKYENLLEYHGIREARQQDQETALENGMLLEVEYQEEEWKENGGYNNLYLIFKVNNKDKIRRQDWLCGLLRGDSAEAAAMSYEFDDKNLKTLMIADHNGRLANLLFLEYSYRDDDMYITAQTPCVNDYEQGGKVPAPLVSGLKRGQKLYISERYRDFNTQKLADLYERLDDEGSAGILDPASMEKNTGELYDLCREDLISYSHMDDPNRGFTRSQEEAFRHLFEHTVTILQGPPGSGKTDFIARAVITLCRYYHDRGRDLRILVNANSHSAIDNVIVGIRDKLHDVGDIELIKADKMEDQNGITVIGKKDISQYIKDITIPVVVGATNWACADLQGVTFDIVIIDEASQVRASDAMLCLDRGRTDKPCRYLLVGDDDQLSPVLRGHYEKKQGEPYVYGSVFRYFKDKCEEGGADCCLMLEECFRMNEILLRYPAEKIYSMNYKPFSKEIASRHLFYPDNPNGASYEEWIEYALDGLKYDDEHREEYWPLVFCCISGADPGRQNRLELRMVTELTQVLKETIGRDHDEHGFWRGEDGSDGIMGIISPHHEHIENLKNSIADATGMSRNELYIGTVDKLQGQQRDAVIVSYGVTDLESAAMESEFIFNRNRLNVALTRGKAKTIVFFSEILAKCPAELLGEDDEDVQLGIEYVCGLMPFMQRREEDTCISMREFILEEGGKELKVKLFRKRME